MYNNTEYDHFAALLGWNEVERIREIATDAIIDEMDYAEEMEDPAQRAAKMQLLELELEKHRLDEGDARDADDSTDVKT